MTENQKKELNEIYKVKKIEILPEKLQKMWSNVSINDKYKENFEIIKKYIKENFNKRDVILVQGSWGYTYSLVKWAIEEEYIPVYSYIERKRWRKCEKN